MVKFSIYLNNFRDGFISSPGRSPGRAIVLPPASVSLHFIGQQLFMLPLDRSSCSASTSTTTSTINSTINQSNR